MHDLNTISRLNAEAFGPAIKNLTDQGRYVVATYTGLHIASIESFSDEDAALAPMHAEVSSPDISRTFHSPTPDAQRVGRRDQSEDRTLADYIGRVQAAEGVVDGEGSDH